MMVAGKGGFLSNGFEADRALVLFEESMLFETFTVQLRRTPRASNSFLRR